MSYRIVIVSGPDQGRVFNLNSEQTLVVGRGDASDTKIDDQTMSRVHFEIHVDGETATLNDKGSAGGTYVQGNKVDSIELTPADIIQAGSCQLRFEKLGSSNETVVTNKPNVPPEDIKALPDLVGTKLGPYQLKSVIAKGASGMVFEAIDSEKNLTAAVKVLAPEFTNNDEQRERFVRAMKTVMTIKDPHIIELHNAGKNGPYCWAAMQLIQGESLADLIERIGIDGMLDWTEVWRIAMHIGRALRVGYEKKIIHRNVTPTNIIRRTKDKASLLGDFMLAKALEGSLAQQITQPGQIIGDLPYMAPERTKDQSNVDTRSDIYGLGATCYALLTGRPPADGDTLPEIIKSVREGTPAMPKQFQLSIDSNFEGVVMKMIAKKPEDRFESPEALLIELQKVGKYSNLSADWSDWAG